jgi:ketosteroid isomerase-like protein
MPRYRRLSWLSLVLLSCTPKPDPAGERAALMAADRAFDSTVATSGLEGWVGFFSDSGRQVDGRGNFVTGGAAIREHMRGTLTDKTRSLRWSPDYAEVSMDGTLGYTWGQWTLSGRDSLGQRELGRGRYLTVWRKQIDGKWKAEADIGNESRTE